MRDEELIDRRGLLKYIPPNYGEPSVLVVESLSYLRELRDLLPLAQIMVLTEYKETAQEFADLRLDWLIGDSKMFVFPIKDKVFDIIIAEDSLTLNFDPYESLLRLSKLIKETGYLVTQFHNIRYYEVLEKLRRGFYPERERRLFAKSEVVRLINDALFKEVSFTPDKVDAADISDWLKLDFDNYNNDLLVKTWIVKAAKSTAEVAALKRFYDYETRRELARLIHRVEYDIERAKSLEQIFNLCRENQIFADYLVDFINSIVVHRETVQLFNSEIAKHLD